MFTPLIASGRVAGPVVASPGLLDGVRRCDLGGYQVRRGRAGSVRGGSPFSSNSPSSAVLAEFPPIFDTRLYYRAAHNPYRIEDQGDCASCVFIASSSCAHVRAAIMSEPGGNAGETNAAHLWRGLLAGSVGRGGGAGDDEDYRVAARAFSDFMCSRAASGAKAATALFPPLDWRRFLCCPPDGPAGASPSCSSDRDACYHHQDGDHSAFSCDEHADGVVPHHFVEWVAGIGFHVRPPEPEQEAIVNRMAEIDGLVLGEAAVTGGEGGSGSPSSSDSSPSSSDSRLGPPSAGASLPSPLEFTTAHSLFSAPLRSLIDPAFINTQTSHLRVVSTVRPEHTDVQPRFSLVQPLTVSRIDEEATTAIAEQIRRIKTSLMANGPLMAMIRIHGSTFDEWGGGHGAAKAGGKARASGSSRSHRHHHHHKQQSEEAELHEDGLHEDGLRAVYDEEEEIHDTAAHSETMAGRPRRTLRAGAVGGGGTRLGYDTDPVRVGYRLPGPDKFDEYHEVLLVGWGFDDAGAPCWIIQNSYGAEANSHCAPSPDPHQQSSPWLAELLASVRDRGYHASGLTRLNGCVFVEMVNAELVSSRRNTDLENNVISFLPVIDGAELERWRRAMVDVVSDRRGPMTKKSGSASSSSTSPSPPPPSSSWTSAAITLVALSAAGVAMTRGSGAGC